MNNISWNNQKFYDKGVIIEKIPTITKAKKRFKTYTIPGRNGVLNIDQDTYDTIACTLECHFKDLDTTIPTLNTWLDGYGKLSLDGVRYYEGIVSNNIPYEQIQNFKKFQVNFTLNPIQKKINATEKELDVSESTQTINVGGTYKTYPVIEVDGTGQLIIRVNETTFTITSDGNYPYILDCEAKEILQNNVNASSAMSGDFPFLIPGDNEIYLSGTGTFTSITITYHESYL